VAGKREISFAPAVFSRLVANAVFFEVSAALLCGRALLWRPAGWDSAGGSGRVGGSCVLLRQGKGCGLRGRSAL